MIIVTLLNLGMMYIYIQISLDFNIEHICQFLLEEKPFTLLERHGFSEYPSPRWTMASTWLISLSFYIPETKHVNWQKLFKKLILQLR